MSAPVAPRAAGRSPRVSSGDPLGGDEPLDDTRDGSPSATGRVRSRWHTLLGAVIMIVIAAAVAGSPWWAPRALARLAFFRVRRVEIDGVRYAAPAELLARLRVDTTMSVWTDVAVLARRVEGHPLVASARVERHLPTALRLVVVEREPVAMAPTRDGLGVFAADGRALPIDPSRVGGVDVPVLAARDTLALRLLGALRTTAPALYARVSEVHRVGGDEMRFAMSPDPASSASPIPFVVRTGNDVTPERFGDLLPVEGDLARRRVRVTEIDLRFRDQVIARLP